MGGHVPAPAGDRRPPLRVSPDAVRRHRRDRGRGHRRLPRPRGRRLRDRPRPRAAVARDGRPGHDGRRGDRGRRSPAFRARPGPASDPRWPAPARAASHGRSSVRYRGVPGRRPSDRAQQARRPHVLLRQLAGQGAAVAARRRSPVRQGHHARCVVTAPAHYQVVSNGLLVEETDLGRRPAPARTGAQSVPIAPWLYVLGVARFAVEHRPAWQGLPIETWVFAAGPGPGLRGLRRADRSTALEFFSNRVGPYSYERLANVQANGVKRRHGGGDVDLLRRRLRERTAAALAQRDRPRDRPPVVRQRGHRGRLGRRLAERGIRHLLHPPLHRARGRARRVRGGAASRPGPDPRLRRRRTPTTASSTTTWPT